MAVRWLRKAGEVDAAELQSFLDGRDLWPASVPAADRRVESVGVCGDGNMNLTLRVKLAASSSSSSSSSPPSSLVVKQGRPFVEKYPQFEAPADRTLVELRIYAWLAGEADGTAGPAAAAADAAAVAAVRERMPRLLGSDVEARTLVLEDCGVDTIDFTSLYDHTESATPAEPTPGLQFALGELVAYLASLHAVDAATAAAAGAKTVVSSVEASSGGVGASDGGDTSSPDPSPSSSASSSDPRDNAAMRALNHEHCFALPLRADNGVDLDGLTPGLAEAAKPLLADAAFAARVAELGKLYSGDPGSRPGAVLLHGDFIPSNWLLVPRRGGEAAGSSSNSSAGLSPPAAARIAGASAATHRVLAVDLEFAFAGPREFDLGVFLAHLLFAGLSLAACRAVVADYVAKAGASSSSSSSSASSSGVGGSLLDADLLNGFAAVELMRRLLGVAQIPQLLGPDMLARKRSLLDLSRDLAAGKTSLLE